MNKTTRLIGLIGCAVAGLAAGWAIHGGQLPGDLPDTGPGAKSDRRSGKRTGPEPPVGVASRVGRIGGMDDTAHRMKAAYAMAMGVPLDRIEEWLNGDYFDTPDSRVDGFFCQILYDRWLDADPEAFISHCLHKDYASVTTTRYVAEWARRDPAAVREFMMGLHDPKDLRTISDAVLTAMAKTDHDGTIALMGDLIRERGFDNDELSGAIATLVKNNPDGMLATSADWPPDLGEHVLRCVASEKLKQDFMGGIEWMLNQRGDLGSHLLNEAMDGDKLGAEFFRHAHELPAGWAKGVIQQEGWSLSRANPEACLALRPEDLGLEAADLRSLRRNALRQFVENDWDKAASMLDGNPGLSKDERRSLVSSLAGELASKNLEEAKAWAATLADPVLRETAESNVTSQEQSRSSGSGPLTPERLVANALNEGGGSSYYETRYWARLDAIKAIDAFQELGPEDRTKAAAKLLRSHSDLPFELRAALLNHQGATRAEPAKDNSNRDPFEDKSREHVGQLARQWAEWEPAAAARWVETLPPGPTRDDATRQVLKAWRLHSPTEAERWAGSP